MGSSLVPDNAVQLPDGRMIVFGTPSVERTRGVRPVQAAELLTELEAIAIRILEDVGIQVASPMDDAALDALERDAKFNPSYRQYYRITGSALHTLREARECRRAISEGDANSAAAHALLATTLLGQQAQPGLHSLLGAIKGADKIREQTSTELRDMALAREFQQRKDAFPGTPDTRVMDQVAKQAGLKAGAGGAGRKAIRRGLRLLKKYREQSGAVPERMG